MSYTEKYAKQLTDSGKRYGKDAEEEEPLTTPPVEPKPKQKRTIKK